MQRCGAQDQQADDHAQHRFGDVTPVKAISMMAAGQRNRSRKIVALTTPGHVR
jgi:hypothetical protein